MLGCTSEDVDFFFKRFFYFVICILNCFCDFFDLFVRQFFVFKFFDDFWSDLF